MKAEPKSKALLEGSAVTTLATVANTETSIMPKSSSSSNKKKRKRSSSSTRGHHQHHADEADEHRQQDAAKDNATKGPLHETAVLDGADSEEPPTQQRRRPPPLSGNPFFLAAAASEEAQTEDKDDDDDDDDIDPLLSHVLEFTTAITPGNRATTEDKNKGDKAVKAMVDYQLMLLRQGGEYSVTTAAAADSGVGTSNLLSGSDVAQLILPWALQQVQQTKQPQQPTSLVWKALSTSLSILVGNNRRSQSVDHDDDRAVCNNNNNNNNHYMNNIVTQSVLFKLVPKVASMAASATENKVEDDDDDDDNWEDPFKSFQMLLDLFHPTMEVACKTVLLPIAITQQQQGEIAVSASSFHTRFLTATLDWIRSIHLSRKGNPKTTFQLLADRSILTAMARVAAVNFSSSNNNNIVRDLWWDGFFHPRHHMEGFAALLLKEAAWEKKKRVAAAAEEAKTTYTAIEGDAVSISQSSAAAAASPQQKSSFRSYHEELVTVVSDCLTNSSAVDIVIVGIVPVLLRGFFQHSKSWDQQERGSSTSSKRGHGAAKRSGDSLALMQYQLFQHWARPLLTMVDATTTTTDPALTAKALHSLREMLQLVLDYDAYSPSQQDQQDGYQYSFLQEIVAQILKIPNDDPSAKRTLLPDAIQSLRTLLRLNHLLLESRIIDAMVLGLDGDGSDTFMSVILVDFFKACVDTYRLLRQQRLIISSIFGAVEVLSKAKNRDGLLLLNTLLDQRELASALATAIQNCPILQVKELVQVVNGWIIQCCDATSHEVEETILSLNLKVAARLSAVLLRNVQVDRFTAADVAAHSKMFVDESAFKLAEAGTSAKPPTVCSAFLTTSLTVCGMALDLYTRCVFWLGGGDQLKLPSPVNTVIQSVEKGLDATEMYSDDLISAVGVLSCQRLRELHSQIYDDDRTTMENPAASNIDEETRTALSSEAKRLAISIGTMAEKLGGRQWIIVAQHFNSWISYADKTHIDQFLMWVVQSACFALDRQMRPDSVPVRERIQDEEAVYLLNDVSFFEHSQVSTGLSMVGLSVAAHFIASALSSSNAGKKKKEFSWLVLTPSKKSLWKRSTEAELLALVKWCTKVPSGTTVETASFLENALYPILLINGIHGDAASEKDALDILDVVFRIDHLCRSLCTANLELTPSAISVVTALRSTARNLLMGAQSEAVFDFLCSVQGLGGFVCGIMTSTIRLLVSVKDALNPEGVQDLLDSTGDLIACAARCSPTLTVGTAKQVSGGLLESMKTTESEWETIALAGMVRRLLEGLAFQEWPSLYPGDEQNELHQQLHAILVSAYRISLASANSLSLKGERIIVRDLSFSDDPPLQRYLLLGDLLRIKDKKWLTDTCLARREMQEFCIHSLKSTAVTSITDKKWNVLSYLVGCITSDQPSSELALIIVDVLVAEMQNPQDVSLLDACLCHAIPNLPEEQLRAVAERVLDLPARSSMASIASRIRLLRFLLRYAVEADQNEVLASFGWDIFMLSLKPLHRKTSEEKGWANHVLVASSLAEDLIRRRDILTLRERDVALLLSYISTTLGPAGGKNFEEVVNDAAADDEDTVVFSAMTELFSTIFQRYTKQLYACVPSAISVLHSFLRHAMYPMENQSPESVEERGQRFARICEQLVAHKDIYKKHVIGLVLEFVHGLGQSLDLKIRNSLIPAIYSLLDTMSTYETKQLDALMDSNAKALFRGIIHQGYQKLHTYKGQ